MLPHRHNRAAPMDKSNAAIGPLGRARARTARMAAALPHLATTAIDQRIAAAGTAATAPSGPTTRHRARTPRLHRPRRSVPILLRTAATPRLRKPIPRHSVPILLRTAATPRPHAPILLRAAATPRRSAPILLRRAAVIAARAAAEAVVTGAGAAARREAVPLHRTAAVATLHTAAINFTLLATPARSACQSGPSVFQAASQQRPIGSATPSSAKC